MRVTRVAGVVGKTIVRVDLSLQVVECFFSTSFFGVLFDLEIQGTRFLHVAKFLHSRFEVG